MAKTKVKGSAASKTEVVLGAILMVLFFTGCSNEFLMDKVRWMAASFMFLGAYFIARGLEWGQLVKKYRTYEALLANDPSGSLSALASATKTSIKEVKQTLNLMIKRGMTGSLTIDEGAERVIGTFSPNVVLTPAGMAPKSAPQQTGASAPSGEAAITEASSDAVVVSCPSCGAKNTMPRDTIAHCGHCGAKIQAK